MKLNAREQHFKLLNQAVRASEDRDIMIEGCVGQRYIGTGLSDKTITVLGTPGNALGAYLNGATIYVHGNAQDATGDTMNDGRIYIDGSSGDATGYAMRGGRIYVRGNAGYRAGIHMKAYQKKLPVLVIGGVAGSFLGEYQAGGTIIVLGIGNHGKTPVGNFCGTGMHGGKIYLRCNELPHDLPKQVVGQEVSDLSEILPYIDEFCDVFGQERKEILSHRFYLLTPDSKNPYHQLYTQN